MMATPALGKDCSSSEKLRNWRSRRSVNASVEEAFLIAAGNIPRLARAREEASLPLELGFAFFQKSRHAFAHVAGGSEQAKEIGFQPQRIIRRDVVAVIDRFDGERERDRSVGNH